MVRMQETPVDAAQGVGSPGVSSPSGGKNNE